MGVMGVDRQHLAILGGVAGMAMSDYEEALREQALRCHPGGKPGWMCPGCLAESMLCGRCENEKTKVVVRNRVLSSAGHKAVSCGDKFEYVHFTAVMKH